MAEGFEKITSDDDPERCQAITAYGQCLNKAVPGGKNCLAHGGNKQLEKQRKESLRNYQLGKFQAALEKQATSPNIKCLRDEIAILRILMQEKFNKCNDATDLILQSGPISDLVLKIDKVVTSCHKLEGSMGQLLDKTAILQFANEVIKIIAVELEGEEVKLNKIADQILKIVGRDD